MTERRTREDWTQAIKDLVDVHSPAAERIVLVLDNLNIHSPASLYVAFAPKEAKRLPDIETLTSEVAAWEETRNEVATTLNWRFTTADARFKLKHFYPSHEVGETARQEVPR